MWKSVRAIFLDSFRKTWPTFNVAESFWGSGCRLQSGGKIIFKATRSSIVGENIRDNEFSLANVLDKKSLSVQSFVDEPTN